MKHEKIKQLYELYNENKLSHVFLIETNNIEFVLNDIYELIKTIEDNDSINSLIDNRSLNSIVEISKNGKNIKKDSIVNLRNNFSKKSIYTKNNYYIILEPETMNDTAYNKMLTFMEEPEDNIYGFLISININFVPDTIYSRCQKIRCFYDNIKDFDSNYKDLIEKYLIYISKNKTDYLWYNENVIFKELIDRQNYLEFFQQLLKYFLNIIKEKNNIQVVELIRKYLNKLEYNVNTNLLFNSFTLEMVDIYE